MVHTFWLRERNLISCSSKINPMNNAWLSLLLLLSEYDEFGHAGLGTLTFNVHCLSAIRLPPDTYQHLLAVVIV